MNDMKVSVIIPLAPNEEVSPPLSKQLSSLPKDWEILICSPKIDPKYRLAENGRANCLNTGAKLASGEFLWFLHADSLLAEDTTSRLTEIMEGDISALYYFDLAFHTTKSHWIRLNELGVRFRCKYLNTPFGDQGFFMRKELFDNYGDYSVTASYGEDHLLVRNFRRNYIPIKSTGIKLYTSAQKYRGNGWLRTTFSHLYFWLKQAILDEKL